MTVSTSQYYVKPVKSKSEIVIVYSRQVKLIYLKVLDWKPSYSKKIEKAKGRVFKI